MTDTQGWHQQPDGTWRFAQHPQVFTAPPQPDGRGGWTEPVLAAPEASAQPPAPAVSDGGLRPDVAAAKAKMRMRFGGGREIKRLVEHLWPGETVQLMTTGTYGRGNGLVALTDKRLLFILEGVMSKTSEDFPLDKVSSVQWSSGMLTGTIVIFASGNKAEITNVNKDDGKAIVDAVRSLTSRLNVQPPAAPQQTPPPAAPVPDVPSLVEQLTQLAALRDQGILTDDEFAAQKARLLT